MQVKKLFMLASALTATLAACNAPENTETPAAKEEALFSDIVVETGALEADFKNPPASAKCGTYWYWINGNISKEGITKDLETMKLMGIQTAFIGDIFQGAIKNGGVKSLSEEWWQCIEHAIKEGDRIGVDIGLFNSTGWSQSGGIWVEPKDAMRNVKSILLSPAEAKKFKVDLEYFEPICALAYPAKKNETLPEFEVNASENIKDVKNFFDNNRKTFGVIEKSPASFEIKFKEKISARSLEYFLPTIQMVLEAKLYAKIDGSWQLISSRNLMRTKDGPLEDGAFSDAFDECNAKEFKIVFSETTQAVKILDINFSQKSIVPFYVEKQLGRMSPVADISPDSYLWKDSPKAREADEIKLSEIVELKLEKTPDGFYTVNAPEGDYVVQICGMELTGKKNAPASAESTGLEVDKASFLSAQKHFDSYIGVLLNRMKPEDRKALKYVIADSYECGAQNWTDDFKEKFEAAYGYNPDKWMPVLTGQIVENLERSERFLWDLRRLNADLIPENYVAALRKKCEENNLILWLENYGHWGFSGEFLNYGGASNEIGGEFWIDPLRGDVECRCATSAGAIYGKKRVSAEAFTTKSNHYQTPKDFKVRGDWAWSVGVNHFVMHVFVHQPDDASPGITPWFGTYFNRSNTWAPYSRTFFEYIERGSAILQHGKRVTDVAYFISEDTPNMTGPQDPKLPRGFDFDFINKEILMTKARAQNGRLVLESGASYSILVLPNRKAMTPELVQKITELVEEGVVILGNAPEKSPSNKDYPTCDELVRNVASRMWIGEGEKSWEHGLGKVFSNVTLEEAFTEMNLQPDITMPSGFVYTHREENNQHVYFVSNQDKNAKSAEFSFRITGMQPEIWDAQTGEIRELKNFFDNGRRIKIPLEFKAFDSFFIVFRNQTTLKVSKGENFPLSEYVKEISSLDWQLEFESSYQPKFGARCEKLIDWSKAEHPDVKYFSGKAVYTKDFTLDSLESGRLYVNLGEVGGLAQVFINGFETPVLWREPYRVNLMPHLRIGKNTIQVVVINSWYNRLIGDSQPNEKPRANFIANGPYWWNDKTPLISSGLIGPVILEKDKQ